MALYHLVAPTDFLANLEVEHRERLKNFRGPAFFIPPHETSLDFVLALRAAKRPARGVYKEQKWYTPGYLTTVMGKFGGGIPIKADESGRMKPSSAREFIVRVYEAFDRDELVVTFPEGDGNQGKLAVARSIVDLPKMARNYENGQKSSGDERQKVAIIACGIEYKRAMNRPWPIKIDIPLATRVIVRFGEPIYPSDHPEFTMDYYMREIAKLSNRPYGPDLETESLVKNGHDPKQSRLMLSGESLADAFERLRGRIWS